jgi:hypothetical protein
LLLHFFGTISPFRRRLWNRIDVVSKARGTKTASRALPRYTTSSAFADYDIRNDSGRGDIAVVWPFLLVNNVLGDLLALGR